MVVRGEGGLEESYLWRSTTCVFMKGQKSAYRPSAWKDKCKTVWQGSGNKNGNSASFLPLNVCLLANTWLAAHLSRVTPSTFRLPLEEVICFICVLNDLGIKEE